MTNLTIVIPAKHESESLPIVLSQFINKNVENDFNFIMDVISSIRNIRSELNISPKKEANLICRGDDSVTKIISKNAKYFSSMVKIKNIVCGEDIEKPDQSATAVISNTEIFLPLADLIDVNIEINRLESKLEDIRGRMNAVKKKLDNNNFIKNAPIHVVEHEKNKFNNYKVDFEKLTNNLNNLISK